MRKTTFAAAILLAASTLTVKADPLIDNIITAYQNGGFTGIEIYNSATTVKVEAYRDGMKYEVIYDRATGAEISSEVKTETDRRTRSEDSDHVSGHDDGPLHDLNDDHGRNRNRGHDHDDDDDDDDDDHHRRGHDDRDDDRDDDSDDDD
jgi:hypothetical protein